MKYTGYELKRRKGIFRQGTCLEEGCSNPRRAENFCNKHYYKYWIAKNHRETVNPIIADVSAITGLPHKKSRQILKIILRTIREALKNKDEVYICGFGYFGVHNGNKRYLGRNPYFWPASELVEMVRHEGIPKDQPRDCRGRFSRKDSK